MRTISDTVLGALKLTGLPDRMCFTSWLEFVQALPELLSVEVPTSASNVLVGNDYPNADETNKIWYRRDPGGNFIGIYAFQNGQWRLLYNQVLNQISWLYGNSTTIPDGFILIEPGDSQLPSNVVSHLVAQYVPIPGGGYSFFAVRYVGY